MQLNIIDKSILKKINFLKSIFLPYTNRVYIVGGFVRDTLLGIKTQDIDIEVHGIDIKTFEQLMKQIKAKEVGKNFFVYKYQNIDISLPRTENKIGIGHKGFEVKLAKNEYEASIRRDFTINALMYNIYDGTILDFHNGIDDLKNKLIKVINKTKFIEDSLRALRAVRFTSKLGFKIHKHSLSLIQTIQIN